jgi:hypothetical protein
MDAAEAGRPDTKTQPRGAKKVLVELGSLIIVLCIAFGLWVVFTYAGNA